MNRNNQSDKAVLFIINQIEKLEKKAQEYRYDINSIELEINTIYNKMVELLNKSDKTESLFTPIDNNDFKQKEYNSLKNKKNQLEELKVKKSNELNEIINNINEMKKVINNDEELDEQNVDKDEEDSEILWILEDDRQRISRDIHDTVVQSLTALIHKEEFIYQIVDKDVNRAKIEVNNAKSIIRESIEELRNIIYQLRPMELDDLGFSEALLNLIDKLDDNYKDILIHTTIDCSDDISQIISISCLRIINELSSNSYKHANCSNIYIDISTDCDYIHIDYKDDGIGFDYNSIGKVKSNNCGYGIRMLNERVALLKGSINYNKEKAQFLINIPLH